MMHMGKESYDVCIISLYLYPISPGHGTRYALSVLEALLNAGYKVEVITSFPNVSEKFISQKYRVFKLFLREKYKGASIIRINIPKIPHTKMLNRIIVYSWFIIISTLITIFTSRRYRVVFGLSPYPIPLLMLSGQLISVLKRSKYVAFMGDLWPDALFDLGIVKGKVTRKLVILLHKVAFKLAHHLAVLTQAIKEGLAKWGVPKNKVSVIKIGIDTSLFKPLPKNKELLKEIGIDCKFVVMYSGIFGPAYDFDTLLEAAKLLEDSDEIRFVIRGDGERKDEIVGKLQALNLRNTIVLPPVGDISQAVDYLNLADVFVVPMMPVNVSTTAHPSKIFEFLSLAKPVISNAEGALYELIQLNGCGLIVKPGDPEQLKEAILNLYNDRYGVVRPGSRGRKLILKYFSYLAVGQQVHDMIVRICLQ